MPMKIIPMRVMPMRLMPMRIRTAIAALLAVLASVPLHASAQAWEPGDFDVSALVAGTRDVLQRAPDREIDALFQAVHASAAIPREAEALCAMLEPDADRSLEGLDRFAGRLGDASRERFADALANVLVAGLQGAPQAYDAAAARQALKSNAARAAILHEGFVAGLNAGGDTAAGRAARCRSLRWMLDTLHSRPLPERALVTRLLLGEGVQRLQPTQ